MKLALPSGRVVVLSPRAGLVPAAPEATGPLFAEARALFRDGGVRLETDGGEPLAVDDLALVDFHALRAIAGRAGWLYEPPVTVPCINCEAPLTVTPSKLLPIGPFLERALKDDELDHRLEENVPHEIPPIPLDGDGAANDVVLRSVTVKEASPLHVALGKRRLRLDASVVQAMGVVALGEERDPARIAAALSEASEEAWAAIGRLFVHLHYPLRLFGVARCTACGARNDLDAPFDREFDEGPLEPAARSGGFVDFETFADEARKIAKRTFDEAHEREISLVVEGGVPLCDEGGIALLGSYLPGSPGDGMTPSRPHEIAVYYRTFKAMWNDEAGADAEEGAAGFDWAAELRETIEHEYEHFLAEGSGGDPMDEEERREIADEAIRIHGKSTLLKSEAAFLGSDLFDFLRKTWLLWAIIVAVAALLASR